MFSADGVNFQILWKSHRPRPEEPKAAARTSVASETFPDNPRVRNPDPESGYPKLDYSLWARTLTGQKIKRWIYSEVLSSGLPSCYFKTLKYSMKCGFSIKKQPGFLCLGAGNNRFQCNELSLALSFAVIDAGGLRPVVLK